MVLYSTLRQCTLAGSRNITNSTVKEIFKVQTNLYIYSQITLNKTKRTSSSLNFDGSFHAFNSKLFNLNRTVKSKYSLGFGVNNISRVQKPWLEWDGRSNPRKQPTDNIFIFNKTLILVMI